MLRESPIKYDDVATAAMRLVERNVRPSNRHVLAELGGGSLSTISPLLKAWQQREVAGAGVRSTHESLFSDELRTALNGEFTRREKAARAEADTRLKELEDHYAIMEASLVQAKQRIAGLETQVVTVHDATAEKERRLEQELAGLRAQLDEAAKSNKELQRRATEAHANSENSCLLAAESRVRSDAAAEAVRILGAENAELRAALDKLKTDLADSQRMAAVADERARGCVDVTESTKSELVEARRNLQEIHHLLREAEKRAESNQRDAEVRGVQLRAAQERLSVT